MRLTRLEINGFKSFCNKTEIIFPQNITGIVGPNGSGKSNIADAVRWVLGEQNPRLLRGGKMEDVIFNGTQKRKQSNFCEVSLVFDNEDKKLHSDYEEIMVTRRVYRNGDSEYEINKSPCRLKDIIEMFSDTGIGKEGYSIVGQGKIDEILSKRTEDRRAVFEEAAGISYYKIKKHDAELRLNRTNENLLRINDIINEQLLLLDPLFKQSEDAKKYLVWNEELKKISCALFYIDYDRIKAREINAKNNIENTDLKIEALEKNISDIESSILLLENEISSSEAELESLSQNISESLENISIKKQGLAEYTAKLQSEEKNIKEYAISRDNLLSKIDELSTNINNGNKNSDLLKINLENLKKDLDAYEESFSKEEININTLREDIEFKKNEIIENINSLSMTESKKSRLLAIKEQMLSHIDEYKKKYEKILNAENVFLDDLKLKQEKYDNENEKLNDILSKKELYIKELEILVASIRECEGKIFKLSQDLSALESKEKTMTNMLNSYEGYLPAVKSAMNYASSKKINGVYGTLASVISVPQKYETAIDMVLGSTLQNIITESESEAKILIEYLRTNKYGRATFLPITSIKSAKINDSDKKYINMSGCFGYAHSLLKYDQKYSSIVENLLARTIVVNTLDDAIAIRKAGCTLRIVTLLGDVMHSGGSMTGGSVSSKNTNFLSRKRIIEDLKKEISELIISINQYKDDLKNSLNKKSEIENLKNTLDADEQIQKIVLARLAEALESSKSDMDSYVNDKNELKNTILELEIGLSNVENELKDHITDSNLAQKKKEDLSVEVENLSLKLKKNNSEFEKSRRKLEELRLNYSESKYNYEQVLKEKINAQNLLDELSKDKAKFEASINSSEKSIAEYNIIINKLNSELLSANDENKVLTNKKAEIEEKRISNNKKLKMSNEELNNTNSGKIKLLDNKHKFEITLNTLELEKKALSDMLWNNYELTYDTAYKFKAGDDFVVSKAQSEQRSLRDKIKSLGSINVNAIEEYNDLKQRNDDLQIQRDDLNKSIEDLNTLINTLMKNMEKQFVDSFEKVKEYFSETFSRLFNGGVGEIVLTEPNDALNSGIEIIVQPPGKKKQILSLFSGGERALTAIALILSMLKLRPSPFCIFDEIEAALDDANVGYFADYLKEFSDKTQFIVVTHRKGTMERCDSLYGVTMAEKGVSSMLSLDLTKY